MRFFFDNNLPQKLAGALGYLENERGIEIKHLRDLYKPNEKDTVWIADLGKQGDWVILTKDNAISKNHDERLAWEESKLPIIFFASSLLDQDFWELSSKVIKAWPTIKATLAASSAKRFDLTANGKIKPS